MDVWVRVRVIPRVRMAFRVIQMRMTWGRMTWDFQAGMRILVVSMSHFSIARKEDMAIIGMTIGENLKKEWLMDFLPETVLNVDVGYSRSYFRQLQSYSRVLPLTYDETISTCTMTGTDCATLSCGSTGFEITFQSALFNLDDGQSSATFAGGFLLT